MGVLRARQGPHNPLGSEGISRVEEHPQYQGQRVTPGGFPSYTWGPSVPDAHGDTLLGRWGPRGSDKIPRTGPQGRQEELPNHGASGGTSGDKAGPRVRGNLQDRHPPSFKGRRCPQQGPRAGRDPWSRWGPPRGTWGLQSHLGNEGTSSPRAGEGSQGRKGMPTNPGGHRDLSPPFKGRGSVLPLVGTLQGQTEAPTPVTLPQAKIISRFPCPPSPP